MRVWKDTNRDVGNGVPLESDPPQTGNGYEQLIFDQGRGDAPDLAWARVAPTQENIIQVAIKSSVLNDDRVFLWSVWASRDLLKPAWFDYNDHFTLAQAGSPLIEDTANYPIKSLAGLDSTCRQGFGIQLTGYELNACAQPPVEPPVGETPIP